MEDFVNFLLTKVYDSKPIPYQIIEKAFDETIVDITYHFPGLSAIDIKKRIISNSNELALFLFRLGRELHVYEEHDLKAQIHWLLKEICCCEIYFNNEIQKGFYIVHGLGTVVGSRNKIGEGFKIHQGCTIGHKKNGEGNGSVIGNNVTMYCNSSIIGELIIGNDVIIGANVLVYKDIENNKVLTVKNQNEQEYLK